MSTKLKMFILAIFIAAPFSPLYAADSLPVRLEPGEKITLEFPLPQKKKNFFIYESRGKTEIEYDDDAKVITIFASNDDGHAALLSYENKLSFLSITLARPEEGSLLHYGNGRMVEVNGGLSNSGPIGVNLKIVVPRHLEGKTDFDKPNPESADYRTFD